MSFKLNAKKVYSPSEYAALLKMGKVSEQDIESHFNNIKAQGQFADNQIKIQEQGPSAVAANQGINVADQFLDANRNQKLKDINLMVPNLLNQKQQISNLGPGGLTADNEVSIGTRRAQDDGYAAAQQYKAYKEQILNPQLKQQLGTDLMFGLGILLSK